MVNALNFYLQAMNFISASPILTEKQLRNTNVRKR